MMLWLFWCSLGWLAGTYVAYPAVLVAAAWLMGRATNGELENPVGSSAPEPSPGEKFSPGPPDCWSGSYPRLQARVLESADQTSSPLLNAGSRGGHPSWQGSGDSVPGEQPGSSLSDLPSLTVIFSYVAAGQEEGEARAESLGAVRRRVADILASGYPREKLQIVAVSDGTLEGTAELQAEFAEQREPVLILGLAARRGKTAAQNLAVRHAAGEVLIFTDADTRFLPGALQAVVGALRQAEVGCVSGRLTYEGRSMEGLYWRYEMALKRAEARLHSLIGANGALYALRRAEYAELPDWALSDLVEPLYQLFEGRRTALAADAVAVERVVLEPGEAFRRKRRITLRALGSLPLAMPAFDAMRRPLTACFFVAHKVLRWFSWIPALGMAISSAALAAEPFYGLAAVVQVAFYGYGAGARLGLPGAALPAYVIEVLVAQLAAGADWVAGRRQVTWPPSSAAPRGRRRSSWRL